MSLFAHQAIILRQRASQIAGFAVVMIAVTTMAGWWSLFFSSAGGPAAIVKPTTALCLAALGFALMHPDTTSRFVFALGLAVAAIAMLDLLNVFGVESGIDWLNRQLVPPPARRRRDVISRNKRDACGAFADGCLADA